VREAWFGAPFGSWSLTTPGATGPGSAWKKIYTRKDRAGTAMEVNVSDREVCVRLGKPGEQTEWRISRADQLSAPPSGFSTRLDWFRDLPDSVQVEGRPLNRIADGPASQGAK
jgi:hypothetical protein